MPRCSMGLSIFFVEMMTGLSIFSAEPHRAKDAARAAILINDAARRRAHAFNGLGLSTRHAMTFHAR